MNPVRTLLIALTAVALGIPLIPSVVWQRVAALAFLAVVGFPTFAAAQLPDSATTSSRSTTTTTWTSEEFISDWRLWAVVGAVLLVILVIALTRGRGDNTTIVK